MSYKQCVILLPCHSLEDFPTHHEGDDAQGLLAGWTALFHPGLIASSGSMPQWWRMDDPGEELADHLLIIPSVSASELPTGFTQRAKDAGATLIRRKQDRDEILNLALQNCDNRYQQIDPELVADFLALGYAYLLIELLTRQMRYACNLDEVHFNDLIVAGAQAAVEGDHELAKQKLTACFDVLAEERDHYYSVEAFLVDLTLVAPTTLGPALTKEIEDGSPTNLLLTGEVIDKIADQHPDLLAAIQSAIAEKRLTIVGGEQTEQRLPQMSLEDLRSALQNGGTAAANQFGQRPTVFGRRTFGLTPALPQILNKLGFRGAIHATLDDGRFPEGQQLKTRWEGPDHSAIDAIARAPLNAKEPQNFLGYANKLGETMDMDHVATLFFAHWPGQASCWYNDLKRIAKYGPLLGRMVTLEEYFGDTDFPAHLDSFTADQYRAPYLKQDVIRNVVDPISSRIRYWRQVATAAAAQKLAALTSLVTSRPSQHTDPGAAPTDQLAAAASDFATALPRQPGSDEAGHLVANPLNFTRRLGVELPQLENAPAVASPIYAADKQGESPLAVVDVPAMGFAWVTGSSTAARPKKGLQDLVQDLTADDQSIVLRNEFFQATLNTITGTLQSLHDYKTRGNRLSQQLAMRLKPGKGVPEHELASIYSVMAADETNILHNSTTMGEVEMRGRLLERDGETVATFIQRYQVWRGSRVLRLQLEIQAEKEFRSDPWNSYAALRFAWADEGAEIWRTVNETRHKTESTRFETSHYVEVDSGDARTTILTGGLPYHRKQGLRMLDSLLLVRGETATQFELGIGVDLKHPMQQALELLTPTTIVPQQAARTAPADSRWLLHLPARNVQATHWEAIQEGEQIVGFRVRLVETDGRPAKVKLSSFKPVSKAHKSDFQAQSISDCDVEDGAILFELSGHEWAEIEARW